MADRRCAGRQRAFVHRELCETAALERLFSCVLLNDRADAPRMIREEQVGDVLAGLEEGGLCLTIGVRPVFRGGRTWLVNPAGGSALGKAAFDQRLVAALREAHANLEQHQASPLAPPEVLRSAAGIDGSYIRKMVMLAFLAPDIQAAILAGRQPPGLTFTRILEEGVPLAWADQRARFGFPTIEI